ncbi:hypothetical protein WS72_19335 [Burkholderia savannae]|uniref:Methyltransferase small domain-containing protein n=1 Tax=Burkholderia savannae TaxID=1637837 RepID=A0ABR5T8G8_9BURK|nr:DUF3560 domain-containing protein [Burkholderia savannae]KWZ39562.1 hypothetical protein WS72_19335 [Burkholderia savannae]
MSMTATYSPEDNKLRLYPIARLDGDTYRRVRELGFIHAPKQGLFVAPKWTPAREDILIELCGEIGDEDTSLVDRAEERADRFTGYSGSRARDAQAARNAVAAISEHIPFGQPILVGHHSEARARRDAERIGSGMRRAVQMWETSEYWQRRAAGALQHAKFKERPDVRYRRIKGIEADLRAAQRIVAAFDEATAVLGAPDLTAERAKAYANTSRAVYGLWGKLDNEPEEFRAHCARALEGLARARVAYDRWIAHYGHRIAYERAMLGEQGGLAAENVELEAGGRVRIDNEWLTITRVNKKDGKPVSVSTNARYVRVRGIEEIKEYQAPSAEQAATVKRATTLAPLVNYPGEGFAHMTKAAFQKVPKDYRGTRKIAATDTTARHRVRSALGVWATPDETDSNKRHAYPGVFITDAKRVDPPAVTADSAATAAKPTIEPPAAVIPPAPRAEHGNPADAQAVSKKEEAAPFKAMAEQLRAGIQVVSAPQLFPTPASLAARMVELADIRPGHSVLEPSAGTGRILRAIREATGGSVVRTAVEISARLCDQLRTSEAGADVVNCDFLKYDAPTQFDRILMNPPFANGDDIRHILHARQMLRPGGRLVAICANGTRQNAQLRPLVEEVGGEWIPLPANSFAESGTAVNAAMLVLTA